MWIQVGDFFQHSRLQFLFLFTQKEREVDLRIVNYAIPVLKAWLQIVKDAATTNTRHPEERKGRTAPRKSVEIFIRRMVVTD